MTTDAEFLLAELEAGPRTTMQLITESIRTRGCGLTPHSRVADLRRGGYDIVCTRLGTNLAGRPIYQYRLHGRAVVESRPSVEREPRESPLGLPAAPLDAPNPDQLVLA